VEVIASTQNKFVKTARSLAQKKFRNETGLFLVEGINLLRDMPTSVEIAYIFATEARLDEAKSIMAEREGAEIFAVTQAVMESISDTVTPYGIAAVCRIPTVGVLRPVGKALLLDGVSDPGNLGTILRTAAACDFCDVYALDCADVYSPKVIRATLGALFKVRVCEVTENQAISLVRETDSAALDMSGENILNARVTGEPLLFIAGNEAHGVREIIKREAKKTYSLPMKNGMESLNVAVATAVAMYRTI